METISYPLCWLVQGLKMQQLDVVEQVSLMPNTNVEQRFQPM
jgi:hypothetical protein